MGHLKQQRDLYRSRSNNSRNTNKNICVLSVARALGVSEDTRYLHTMEDLTYAIRKRWSCRSVKTALKVKPLKTTVAQAVKQMRTHEAEGLVGYVVGVPGHVLLMNKHGDVEVDTAPRKADRRRIDAIYGVYRV